MKAAQRDELRRALGHAKRETRRYADEVLADVEITCCPSGDAPDATLCAVVRAERAYIRGFGRTLERHAARLRGGR